MKNQQRRGFTLFTLIVVFAFLVSACAPKVTAQPTDVKTVTAVPPTETPIPADTFTPEPTATSINTPTPEFPYKLKGLDWGPYTDVGQNPELGTIISQEQLKAQLKLIAPYTEWVRTYACQGLSEIVPLAHEMGIKVAMGAWLGQDTVANEVEIACLISNAMLTKPEMVIVGSETLLRNDLSPNQLIDYLRRVRMALPPEIQVTTADTAIGYTANRALVSAVDVVMVNLYPYWSGVDIGNSMTWLNSEYDNVVARSQGKQVWISETGWPSCDTGSESDYAVNFVSWAKAKDVSYFLFEAFDEPWKWSAEKPQESCWGVWNSDGMKEGMQAIFDGVTVDDNWSPTSTPVSTDAPIVAVVTTLKISGPPAITIKSWPPKGGFEEMTGSVENVDPSKYMVACYLEVGGGWWTKPTWDRSLSPIDSWGDWSCAVTTGGIDEQATTLKVFLLPKGVSAPQASGGGEPSLDYPSATISR